MGPSALTFYRRLADLLGERRNTPFNVIMAWMRTRLSFALLRASKMPLRGSCVRRTVPWNDLPADVVVCAGGRHVPYLLYYTCIYIFSSYLFIKS